MCLQCSSKRAARTKYPFLWSSLDLCSKHKCVANFHCPRSQANASPQQLLLEANKGLILSHPTNTFHMQKLTREVNRSYLNTGSVQVEACGILYPPMPHLNFGHP